MKARSVGASVASLSQRPMKCAIIDCCDNAIWATPPTATAGCQGRNGVAMTSGSACEKETRSSDVVMGPAVVRATVAAAISVAFEG